MNLTINKTILLVEDDPMLSFIHSNSLKKYGYKIIIASSGKKSKFARQKLPSAPTMQKPK